MSYVNVYPARIDWENEPSINTPINALNLNKMDYALYSIDQTLASWDTTKANQSDLLLSVKSIDYDTSTGVFVFTWQNGTTKTVDLNIEKIPVSFSMSPQGVITMTTEDGTSYTADVGALIKTYTFTDSTVIDFTVTTDASGNKTVTADIVDGSITGTKLQPNYLADCQTAETNAGNSATAAAGSSSDSEAWAVGTRGGVPVPSTDPAYNNNSYYWAQHGGNSFAGLSDVDMTGVQNGDVFIFDASDSKLKPGNVSIDIDTETPTFTEASTRTNIASGETISTLFGKIKKWFSDLKSGAFTDVRNDLTGIDTTSPTNTTGSTINAGTYFYLDGVLVRAKTNIANGATFTLNTNYEVVTAGALNNKAGIYELIRHETVNGVQAIELSGASVSGWLNESIVKKYREIIIIYNIYSSNHMFSADSLIIPQDWFNINASIGHSLDFDHNNVDAASLVAGSVKYMFIISNYQIIYVYGYKKLYADETVAGLTHHIYIYGVA